MAETFFTASIVCFILSGAFFIVAVALFFSLNIQDTVRRLASQNQVKWVMKGDSKKTKKRPKKENIGTNKRNSKEGITLTLVDTPTDVEDELPTMLDNGEQKQDSLVGVYERENLTEIGEAGTDIDLQCASPAPLEEKLTEVENSFDNEGEVPTTVEKNAFQSNSYLSISRIDSSEDTEAETTELETELEEATENPDDTGKKFQILQTIMYVHTDEVI